MSVIELKSVSKIYKIGEVETHAVNQVDFSVNDGEFVTLVGPSGSGKTTMLQLMGCLDNPDTGSVLINGEDVSRFKANKRADLRRDTIGFIFQFFALLPVLTAYENVELPLLLGGMSAGERKAKAMAMLDAVGMADRVKHRPDQMSGGQQQRVAIARALATNPSLVLADEPTANLDTENGRQAMEIMKKLNQDLGTAFIFATHDPRVIPYASRIVKMRDGNIINADATDASME